MTLKSRTEKRLFHPQKSTQISFLRREKKHIFMATLPATMSIQRRKKKKKSHHCGIQKIIMTQNASFIAAPNEEHKKLFLTRTHFFLISSYWIRRRRRSMRSQKKLSLNIRHWQWQEHRRVTKDSIEARERERAALVKGDGKSF